MDDNDAFIDADLWGGETDALYVIVHERVGHLVRKLPDIVVNGGDRFGDTPQGGISVLYDTHFLGFKTSEDVPHGNGLFRWCRFNRPRQAENGRFIQTINLI